MARRSARGDLSPIHKWTDFGQKLEGSWIGTTILKEDLPPLGKLDTDGGEVLFSMPTVLRNRMRFTPGTYVWIEYVGESPSRHGTNPG